LAKAVRSRIPLILAGCYAALVLCLLILALVTHDEFGFRFIPVLYATYPLSRLFYTNSNILYSILIGGTINAILLFALLKGVAYLWALSRTK
jgi:hypothetical protein